MADPESSQNGWARTALFSDSLKAPSMPALVRVPFGLDSGSKSPLKLPIVHNRIWIEPSVNDRFGSISKWYVCAPARPARATARIAVGVLKVGIGRPCPDVTSG